MSMSMNGFIGSFRMYIRDIPRIPEEGCTTLRQLLMRLERIARRKYGRVCILFLDMIFTDQDAFNMLHHVPIAELSRNGCVRNVLTSVTYHQVHLKGVLEELMNHVSKSAGKPWNMLRPDFRSSVVNTLIERQRHSQSPTFSVPYQPSGVPHHEGWLGLAHHEETPHAFTVDASVIRELPDIYPSEQIAEVECSVFLRDNAFRSSVSFSRLGIILRDMRKIEESTVQEYMRARSYTYLPPQMEIEEEEEEEGGGEEFSSTGHEPFSGSTPSEMLKRGFELLPHQIDALRYMVNRERNESFTLFRPTSVEGGILYSPYLNRVARADELDQPGCSMRGGVLAHEMGLGKTVTALALCLAMGGKTLVVVPVSILDQWIGEIEQKTLRKAYLYHGTRRKATMLLRLPANSIVVTSYGTLKSDYVKGTTLLQPNLFRRVIFDESHVITGVTTLRFKACNALVCASRWCLSGTPCRSSVHNGVGQVALLKAVDLDDVTYLKCHPRILTKIVKQVACYCSVAEVQRYLPHKKVVVHEVRLDPRERETYDDIYRESLATRKATACAALTNLMQRLLLERLRVFCSSGERVPVRKPELTLRAASGFKCVEKQEDMDLEQPCPICLEELDTPVVTPCRHYFCSECFLVCMNSREAVKCPLCRATCTKSNVSRIRVDNLSLSSDKDRETMKRARSPLDLGSKIRAILDLVHGALAEDPTSRFVVFTGFARTLQVIRQALWNAGVAHAYIDGSMAQKKRAAALRTFRDATGDEAPRVFILSLKSGNSGINMTTANHVIFAEPTANAVMQKQAVGRVHRIGQSREVTVHHLYARGTVEERMVEYHRTHTRNSESNSSHAVQEYYQRSLLSSHTLVDILRK